MYMRIIFHYPLPINPKALSASENRPIKMIMAFQSLGYQVDLITGFVSKRRICINRIRNNIIKGIKYRFMYSESTTWPTFMPDKHHLIQKPSYDFRFFKFLKKNNIPIGLFYRDVYWVFPQYYEYIPYLKAKIAKFLYRYDLRQYKKYLTKFYLPSMEMVKYIPLIDSSFCSALPPGHSSNKKYKKKIIKGKQINLLYVGGIGLHYQMHKVFNVVASRQDVTLIICTRRAEWEVVKHEYINPLPSNINIIHKGGDQLGTIYARADIASLFVLPQVYWGFAAPFKLYEYLGERKPIVASRGTLAGRFVEENMIGWCIPYEEHELNNLFDTLIENPHLIEEKMAICDKVSINHSWIARAKQVEQDLRAD